MKGKKACKKNGTLSRAERIKLMAETQCDERTIRRWERADKNKPVKSSTADRLTKAAKKLGILVPERADGAEAVRP